MVAQRSRVRTRYLLDALQDYCVKNVKNLRTEEGNKIFIKTDVTGGLARGDRDAADPETALTRVENFQH